MKLHHPIILEDETERFLLSNGSYHMHDRIHYYIGTNNEQVVLHSHKSGDEFGESIFLDKNVQEFEAVHSLMDVLIEGMSGSLNKGPVIYHKATCSGYVVITGHSGTYNQDTATLAIYQESHFSEATLINLPYNRVSLEVVKDLLKLIK